MNLGHLLIITIVKIMDTKQVDGGGDAWEIGDIAVTPAGSIGIVTVIIKKSPKGVLDTASGAPEISLTFLEGQHVAGCRNAWWPQGSLTKATSMLSARKIAKVFRGRKIKYSNIWGEPEWKVVGVRVGE